MNILMSARTKPGYHMYLVRNVSENQEFHSPRIHNTEISILWCSTQSTEPAPSNNNIRIFNNKVNATWNYLHEDPNMMYNCTWPDNTYYTTLKDLRNLDFSSLSRFCEHVAYDFLWSLRKQQGMWVVTKFVWWTCVSTWSSAMNSLVACRFILLMASFWAYKHLEMSPTQYQQSMQWQGNFCKLTDLSSYLSIENCCESTFSDLIGHAEAVCGTRQLLVRIKHRLVHCEVCQPGRRCGYEWCTPWIRARLWRRCGTHFQLLLSMYFTPKTNCVEWYLRKKKLICMQI